MIYYFHGGACLLGSTSDLDPRHASLLSSVAPVVAVPYMLAIGATIFDTIRGLEADLTARIEGDPDPVFVGHSFGGYLAVLMACRLPAVRTCVSFNGYGDLLADFYTAPSEFYAAMDLPADFDPAEITEEADAQARMDLYVYLRAKGLWPEYVSGGHSGRLAEESPLRFPSPRDKRFMLVHGRKDTDVPFTESVQLYDHLRQSSTESELLLIDEGGHGFFRAMDCDHVTATWDAVIDYIRPNKSLERTC